MKINTAVVVDPRDSGARDAPYLLVVTDSEPTPYGKAVVASSPGPQMEFTQFGPFWNIDPKTPSTLREDVIVGYANSAAPTRLDKLVPIEVQWGDNETQSFAMSVTRARRLLRKYNQPYVYTLSDVAARAGRIQWDLECNPMRCKYWLGGPTCGLQHVVDVIVFAGVQYPACSIHVSALRREAKNLRLEREGARR